MTPVIVQPDIEAWVWANIRGVTGTNSFAYAASQVGHTGWIWAHFVQVDVRSKHNKQTARDGAERVRQIMSALPEADWGEGTICYLQVTEGPFWLPDDDGLPRYVTRYEIRVHPRRDSGAVLTAAAVHPASP